LYTRVMCFNVYNMGMVLLYRSPAKLLWTHIIIISFTTTLYQYRIIISRTLRLRRNNHYFPIHETRDVWYLSIVIIIIIKIPISFRRGCYVTRSRRLFRCSIMEIFIITRLVYFICVRIPFVVLRESSFYSIIVLC